MTHEHDAWWWWWWWWWCMVHDAWCMMMMMIIIIIIISRTRVYFLIQCLLLSGGHARAPPSSKPSAAGQGGLDHTTNCKQWGLNSVDCVDMQTLEVVGWSVTRCCSCSCTLVIFPIGCHKSWSQQTPGTAVGKAGNLDRFGTGKNMEKTSMVILAIDELFSTFHVCFFNIIHEKIYLYIQYSVYATWNIYNKWYIIF